METSEEPAPPSSTSGAGGGAGKDAGPDVEEDEEDEEDEEGREGLDMTECRVRAVWQSQESVSLCRERLRGIWLRVPKTQIYCQYIANILPIYCHVAVYWHIANILAICLILPRRTCAPYCGPQWSHHVQSVTRRPRFDFFGFFFWKKYCRPKRRRIPPPNP